MGYDLKGPTSSLIDLRSINLLGEYDPEWLLKGCDPVVHLAAVSNPRLAQANRDLARKMNVGATEKLLTYGRRFVFASTYMIYGTGEHGFTPDESSPASVGGSVYAASKIDAEGLVKRHDKHTICRITNVFGPGQRLGFVVPDVIERTRTAEGPIDIYDPETVLDFLYVDDLVDALLFLLSGRHTGTFNIGSGKETTITEIYDAIRKYFEKDQLDYSVKTNRRGYVVADIGKLKNLGWEPRFTLEEGIDRTVRYFLEHGLMQEI